MANPVLVEVTRGKIVESVHRGSIAIADAGGTAVLTLGDVEPPVYPRSSLKPIQALPLVESGAADAFGLSEEEIALSCASHSSEPMHTERVATWLARLGLGEADLACGAHPSRYEPVRDAMICAHEAPSRLHNNCSGKHAGFLTLAKHLGAPAEGYQTHDHPVQKAVAQATAELAGVDINMPWGVDGCAAPNFALPLSGFARALAKFADPSAQEEARAAAMRRIFKAMTAYPELVSGTGRACAVLMRAGKGRVAVKTGAEGVFAAIIPEAGLGIALKIDDGATRASEAVMAALLEKLGLLHGEEAATALAHAPITNTRGMIVGKLRPAAALDAIALAELG
jgi:L-asparaginase II